MRKGGILNKQFRVRHSNRTKATDDRFLGRRVIKHSGKGWKGFERMAVNYNQGGLN